MPSRPSSSLQLEGVELYFGTGMILMLWREGACNKAGTAEWRELRRDVATLSVRSLFQAHRGLQSRLYMRVTIDSTWCVLSFLQRQLQTKFSSAVRR